MKKKIVWKSLALICLGAILAGCGSESAEEGVNEPVAVKEATDAQTQKDETREENEAMHEETRLEPVTLDLSSVDPMELKSATERAAYFADWVYVNTKGNTLVSPLSLNLALGMAAEGASGQTAKELYDYLGGEDYASFVKDYVTFAESLANNGEQDTWSSGYTFRYEIANSLWINERNRLQEAYRKKMEDAFRAEVSPVDFDGDVAGTVKKINSWCKEKTHDMIPEIVKESDIKPNMKAILINSLYFESPWLEKWSLKEHEFTDFSGNKTTQEMLFGGANQYYENDQAIAFGKNYYNGFSFIGILPKTEGEFSILNLDLESLLKSESSDYVVTALMPKLNYDSTGDALEDLLRSEGVVAPFETSAQFDKIIDGEELYIDRILQKCKIELDENGTKAAAVTAVMMRANGMMVNEREKKEVILDRPFAFLIYDRTNEEIVFVGKVTKVQ